MLKVIPNTEKNLKLNIDRKLLEGKRNLTSEEIAVLKSNGNHSSDSKWNNVYVSEKKGCFNADLVKHNDFSGFVVLGDITDSIITYHDLKLPVGITRSSLCDVVTGDNCAIHNVKYLVNYRIGNRVILFNIHEMSCTKHSKFGEGLIKEGESEATRIWIGVGNENGNRQI